MSSRNACDFISRGIGWELPGTVSLVRVQVSERKRRAGAGGGDISNICFKPLLATCPMT